MFRAAPPSESRSSAIERGGVSLATTSTLTGSGSGSHGVERYATRGARRYPFRLNMYREPPIHEVTIEQFETWAIDRLRVLAEVESSQARNRNFLEMRELVKTAAKKYLPLSATSAAGPSLKGGPDLDAERMKDHVSHFVLRLAFCRTEDLRRRFVKAETTLFRLRFEDDDSVEKERFLQSLKLDWQKVSEDDKQAHRDALIAANPRLASSLDTDTIYKVHWTRVLDLVEKRRVFLHRGTAWVPMREQASLIVAEFSNRLTKDLEMTARALPRLDEDDRILPLLSHLSMGFIAGVSSDYASNAIAGIEGGKVTADMIDALVKKHAPMCMRNLHESLLDKGHLRHYGRLQYNLFLKDIGLPVEEALLFWRRSFRAISDDKFNREYKYNIRYGYGLEGRRVNLPGKNCVNIITQDQPGPQDNHGCPFRHFSPQNLSSALISQYGLNFAEQAEILQAVKAGHYHVGCTRLFEMTHKRDGIKKGNGLGDGESVSHPNRYFERSYALSRGGSISSSADKKGDASQAAKNEEDDQMVIKSHSSADDGEVNMDDLIDEAAQQPQEEQRDRVQVEADEDEEEAMLAAQGS